MTWRSALPALTVLALAHTAWAQQGPRNSPALRRFDTPYYILYTDMGEADVREADLRMTRMFEEYQRRMSGFAGQIKEKFPFYLYRNEADYNAAGGPPGSAGVYMESSSGKKLMAVAGARADAGTWHVVQHEGFHQFVAATIKAELPVWVNEGLAEYFGESIWTGDGFVSGLIPPERFHEVQNGIKSGRFKPFRTMMTMTNAQWGNKLEYSNYDEAWAMIHFLAHADNGKYQAPFTKFLTDVSKGTPWQGAWDSVFGKDTDAFQTRFANWWLSLPDNPTRQGYLQVLVQTQTSFLARAYLQRQTFPDAQAFFKNYQPAGLTLNRDFWLPPELFAEMSAAALRGGDWSLVNDNQTPRLVLQDRDGTTYTGAFAINRGKVAQVAVAITPPGASSSANARKPMSAAALFDSF